MTENTTPKQNPLTKTVNVLRKHKTPILVTVATASVALNVVQNRGISSLNTFLKEQGLFETYYEMVANEAS